MSRTHDGGVVVLLPRRALFPLLLSHPAETQLIKGDTGFRSRVRKPASSGAKRARSTDTAPAGSPLRPAQWLYENHFLRWPEHLW